jgi:hypothetical protein
MTEVRGDQLKPKSITHAQIGDKEVTSQQIADATITNAQISLTADIDQSKINGLVDALANKLSTDNPVISNNLVITNPPTNPTDAANKAYVDQVSAGGQFLTGNNFNLLDSNLDVEHAPFTTDILATQTVSVFNDIDNFSTAGHSGYSVFTNSIAVDLGSKQFLYQLGGSQGTQATQIRNVTKTELSSLGAEGAWSTTGVADLPENSTSTGKGAVLNTTSGAHLVFAKGNGDNLIWRSQTINTTTGGFAGWDLLTPLPSNAGDPELVICDFAGDKVGYLLNNSAGGSSNLTIMFFGSTGDITGFLNNTIPQSVTGKLVALSNTHLYIVGTGTQSNKCFVGTINPATKNIFWSSYTTNLPTGLANFGVTLHSSTDGTNKLYIFGGSLSGVLQNTIYSSTIDTFGVLSAFSTTNTKLEAATEGFGAASLVIGGAEYTYLTGGRRATGFVDNSTSRQQVSERAFKIVRRTIGAGSFYHVNRNESNRPQQAIVIEPTLGTDPSLSQPINVFYFARKDLTNTDYIFTTSLDPKLPNMLLDKEHLLIRADQIDPVTGSVKTVAITTTPITTQDYLDNQLVVNQVFSVNNSLITTTATSVSFADNSFKIGNIRRVFNTQAQSFTGLATLANYFVYWSNYDIILSPTEIEGKVLLGFLVTTGSLVTFVPTTLGLTYSSNSDIVIQPNSNLDILHGFNTNQLSVQVWSDNGGFTELNTGLKIRKIGLNKIQINNSSANAVTIKQVLVKKEN